MSKILIDVRAYDDGGPTDPGYEVGTYWVPARLRPIPWDFDETPEDKCRRVERYHMIERYLSKTYGLDGGWHHSYYIVPDTTKRLDEYRATVERLTALLNEAP